jgi:isopentenyl-diphosphate delta-isomerase
MAQTVLLIDDNGRVTGEMDRTEAHTGIGTLHAAFSVYIFRDERKEFLMQKRGNGKLWAGIWANTCCSHLRRGETPREAGERRLQEEMGFTCPLREEGSFVYRAEDPEGRGVEHERITLLTGDIQKRIIPTPDPAEIAEWEWISVADLSADILKHPGLYTPWFRIGLRRIIGQG